MFPWFWITGNRHADLIGSFPICVEPDIPIPMRRVVKSRYMVRELGRPIWYIFLSLSLSLLRNLPLSSPSPLLTLTLTSLPRPPILPTIPLLTPARLIAWLINIGWLLHPKDPVERGWRTSARARHPRWHRFYWHGCPFVLKGNHGYCLSTTDSPHFAEFALYWETLRVGTNFGRFQMIQRWSGD